MLLEPKFNGGQTRLIIASPSIFPRCAFTLATRFFDRCLVHKTAVGVFGFGASEELDLLLVSGQAFVI